MRWVQARGLRATALTVSTLVIFLTFSPFVRSALTDPVIGGAEPPALLCCPADSFLAGGYEWDISIVDSAGDVGRASSIALGDDGRPHISYDDTTNHTLKYAVREARGEWNRSVVENDVVAEQSSIALENGWRPHISYVRMSGSIDGDLKYAYWNGSAWHPETVDDGDAGWFSSLALDESGRPHISYLDNSSGDGYALKYARWTGTDWEREIVDSSGIVAQGTSLALDASGTPHIAYSDYTNSALRYAVRKADGNWDIAMVDNDADVGLAPSLALDIVHGRSHVSYQDYSTYDLKYAWWDGGPKWNVSVVDSASKVGTDTGLALNPNGLPRIAYSDLNGGVLKYARFTGSGWATEAVDGTSPDEVVWGGGLAIDAMDAPRISYFDGSSNLTLDLKYARWNRYPSASFDVAPSSGGPHRFFEVDASASTDPEDSAADLQVRWDWGEDDRGDWDTDFTTDKTDRHQYLAVGGYTIRMEVRDLGGLTDQTTRAVSVKNTSPLANAGPNQETFRGTLVRLNGSGSLDPENDPLTYKWRQISGPPVNLTDMDRALASFTPAELGDYTFRLGVGDGAVVWENATSIDASGAGPNREPRIAMSPEGKAVAVWLHGDGDRETVWANRFEPDAGWEIDWDNATPIPTKEFSWDERPQIAMNAAGDAMAVFLHWDGIHNTIWASGYDVTSNVWGTPAPIDTYDGYSDCDGYGISSSEVSNPSLAMAPSGDAVAMWLQTYYYYYEYDGDYYEGYCRTDLLANTYTLGSWGTPVPLESENWTSAGSPRFAMDSSGNALAVWEKGGGIWASRYNVTSSLWGNPVAIGAYGGYSDCDGYEIYPYDVPHPSLTVAPSGDAVATWLQTYYYYYYDDYGDYYEYPCLTELWANNYTSGSWGTPVPLVSESWTYADNPRVAMNVSGNAIAVWEQGGGIWANRFVPGEGWMENATQINATSNGTSMPRVALDDTGNAVAIWSQLDNSTYNIWANRYNGTGGNWTTPVLVELDDGDDGNDSAYDPALTMDGAGHGFAWWRQMDDDGSWYRIWVSRLNGTTLGDPKLLGSGTSYEPSLHPFELVVSPAGNATGVWIRHDGLRWNLWAARYEPGTGWEEFRRVDAENTGNAVRPAVAMDDMGNALASWEQWEGTPGIRASRYGAGANWTIAHMFDTEPYNASATDVQVDVDLSGNALAAWVEYGMILASRYVWGDNWGTASLVKGFTDFNRWEPASAPELDMDDAGNALGVWLQGGRVWASRYDVTTAAWDTPVVIDGESGYGSSLPRVAMDSSGNAIAVWDQGYWGYGVWANNYTAGSWGTPVPLEAEDSTYARNPRLAMDASGNAIAVWEQGGGIWANRFVPGEGWGEKATKINTPSAAGSAPRVAIDAAGKATALWTESGGSGIELWASLYVPGDGWEPAEPVETEGMGDSVDSELAVDPAGNAVVVWRQSEGTESNLWAKHHAQGIGWGTAEPIEALAGWASPPQIGADASGNALAVWAQSNGTNREILANRMQVAFSYDDVTVTVVNRAPVANAGLDIPVYGSGIRISLNGTASFDPDAEPFTYLWTQTSGPAFPPLNNKTTARPDFIPPDLGTYAFDLVVTDPQGANDPDTVRVIVRIPGPPIAVAAASTEIGYLLVPITFDASGSIDDNGVTRYLWEFGDGENDTNAIVSHSYASRGTFTVTLTVWDADDLSDSDTLTIRIVNRPPVASASATPPPIRIGQTVVLNGTESTDPDGDPLTYKWKQVGGPPVTLAGNDTWIATFIPDVFGTYEFTLNVSDGLGGFDEASVMITAPNRNPIANAGPDQPAARKRLPITLDATASSDPDGDRLTYFWTAPPGVNLSDMNDQRPTFTAMKSGAYNFTLRVEDGLGGAATDTVIVTVLNTPPVAVASAPPTAKKHAPVTLNGSASWDEDRDDLSYEWIRMSGPFVTIDDWTAAIASFTPTVSGVYKFRLVVDDRDVGGLVFAEVTVDVFNTPPVAVASAPPTAKKHAPVTLDGSASWDEDGDMLRYRWILVSERFVAIDDGEAAIASFTPTVSGVYRFRLVVDDRDVGGLVFAEVTVDVSNAAPTTDAGTDVEARKHTTVRLSGAAFDKDGDVLTFSWFQVSGPSQVTLRNGPTLSPDFVAPAAGVYVLRFQARDPEGATSWDEITVTVWSLTPIAVITANSTAPLGAPMTFDGGGSSDPDGMIVEYAFDFGDGTRPAVGVSPTRSHAFHAPGVYFVSLVVTDDDGNVSARSSVKVTVLRWTNLPPIAEIVVSPANGPPSTVFTFDASSSWDDGGIVDLAWDFGDGTTSTGSRVAHRYRADGRYTITLRVTDDTGLEGIDRASVVVWTSSPPRDVLPPGVLIVSPENGAESPEGWTTVRGTAWDNVGVVAVAVSLDGVTWIPAYGTTEWYATLFLGKGERTILARAFDAAGNERDASVTVFIATTSGGGEPPSGVDPIILVIIIVVGIIITAFWRLRAMWFPYVIYFLYTRLRREEVLDNFSRGEIYGFIRLNPGESYSDIKRSLDLATGTLTYHLTVLERMGLVRSVPQHAQKLFYPSDVRVPENGGDLRALQVRILKVLNEDPGIAVGDLAPLLGVSRHVALYHLRKLVASEHVRLDRRGARLRAFPMRKSLPPDASWIPQ